MKREKRKSRIERKRLRKLDKLDLEYGRTLVNLMKSEEAMNREAARLEKIRSKHKPTYIS